jgi:5'-3' exonuclease
MKQLDSFINDIKKAYCEGLQWVFSYYYSGCPSWEWFYPYHYSPFVSDLKELQQVKVKFNMGKPSLPFEQLMSVFPSLSAHAVPEVYRPLMTKSSSPILDFYPKEWDFDINGKTFAWMGVNLLPFIEMKRLLEAMEPYNALLSEEEKKRNVHGQSLLVFGRIEDRISNFFAQQTEQELLTFTATFHKCKELAGEVKGTLTSVK